MIRSIQPLFWLAIMVMIALRPASAGGPPMHSAGFVLPTAVETAIPGAGSFGRSFLPATSESWPSQSGIEKDMPPDFGSEALSFPFPAEQDDPTGPPGPADNPGGPMPPRNGIPGGLRRPLPMLPPQLMQQLRDLPPEEQQKVLENNQKFQELPKQQQQFLLRQLRRFERLTPEQREMIRQRFETFRRLTPEQRQKARDIYDQKWQALTGDRRKAVLEEFRKMRLMSPEEREKYLASPDVANRFSPDERDLLKQLGTFAPPFRPHPGGPARRFGPPPGPHPGFDPPAGLPPGPPPEPPSEPRP